MEDAFHYIVKHDNVSTEKRKQGKALIQYFDYE